MSTTNPLGLSRRSLLLGTALLLAATPLRRLGALIARPRRRETRPDEPSIWIGHC
jgi:hypothetical protein